MSDGNFTWTVLFNHFSDPMKQRWLLPLYYRQENPNSKDYKICLGLPVLNLSKWQVHLSFSNYILVCSFSLQPSSHLGVSSPRPADTPERGNKRAFHKVKRCPRLLESSDSYSSGHMEARAGCGYYYFHLCQVFHCLENLPSLECDPLQCLKMRPTRIITVLL